MSQDESKTSANAEALADKQKEPEISEELKGEEISGEQEAAPAEPAVEPIPEIPEPETPVEPMTAEPASPEERPPSAPLPEDLPPAPVPADVDLATPPPSEIEEPSADSRPAPAMADKQPQVIEKIEITPQGDRKSVV